VEPDALLAKGEAGKSVLKSLTDKGIFEQVNVSVNRMDRYIQPGEEEHIQLSNLQVEALDSIRTQWNTKEVVLLHGVTGSGKTHVYIELIREAISKGGQVLYLVPEIGMSVQLLRRLQKAFGDQITISHSRLNENERVDLWQQVREGIPVIAGVRSAIFLPFQNLRLIIVDEEHDTSYKQQDPSPRYHARDMAILLGRDLNAKVLLGSATPAIETFFQAENGRYGIVTLAERYQGMELRQKL
jgi:primosomal protein N' (replication factor Y)